eukprot:scaffold63929_cov65-Phaeocystis_antarctica.AAC.2
MPCGQPRVYTYGTRLCAWCALYAHRLCSVRLPAQLAHMSHAALCYLLAPAKPARQDTRRGAVCRAKRQPPAHTLLAPRPLANACLTTQLDLPPSTVPANASSRSRMSAGAAGRGPSDAVPAAPSGRLILIGEVQQAVRRRTRAASCRLAAVLRVAQNSSTGRDFRQTDRQTEKRTA